MVPSLSLGVFGVATSTCDLYGDGDAVVFPVVSKLIPILEKMLLQRSRQPPAAAAEVPVSTPFPASFLPPAEVPLRT